MHYLNISTCTINVFTEDRHTYMLKMHVHIIRLHIVNVSSLSYESKQNKVFTSSQTVAFLLTEGSLNSEIIS